MDRCGHYQPDTAALTLLIRELQQTDGVPMDDVVVIDQAKGITPSAVRYLNADYTDRREKQSIRSRLGSWM